MYLLFIQYVKNMYTKVST